MIDDGCTVEGYQSDLTRTFVLGKATDKMNTVFGIVKRAQSMALATARPGVPLEAIDAAARKVIVEAGYGPGFKYFSHRLGHGIGMEGHEWPYLVKNNMFGWNKALTAQPGMVFSDEPGIYIRGEFGVRLEDDMVHHTRRREAVHAAVGVAGEALLSRGLHGFHGSTWWGAYLTLRIGTGTLGCGRPR